MNVGSPTAKDSFAPVRGVLEKTWHGGVKAFEIANAPFGFTELGTGGRSLLYSTAKAHLGSEALWTQKFGAFMGFDKQARMAVRGLGAAGIAKRVGSGLMELGSPWIIGQTIFDVGQIMKSPREERLSRAGESLINQLAYPAAYGLGQTAAIATGSVFGGYVGAAIAFVGVSIASATVGKGIRMVEQIGRQAKKLELGGDFRDTNELYTLRMRSIQAMSGSLLNARSYLGSEASYFH